MSGRSKLKYVSKGVLETLYSNIRENVGRYQTGDFLDLVEWPGWNIEFSVSVDLAPLAELNPEGTPEAEVENSLLVWKALHELTPALACEDRFWTRLAHVDCFEYSRRRWLKADDDEKTAKDVRAHFFAPGLTSCRDDHSIARLWWNAKIAKDIRPHNQRSALELVLRRADIRSNFVERSWTVSRPRVADAILRAMEREKWVTDKESNYREFMKSVNRRGGGIIFELFEDSQLDSFMGDCCVAAQSSR